MEKGSGEKTSDLEPKTIDSSGVQRLKKLAKRKQKEQGCKLSDALELVAQEHGFKNWNNVHRFASKRPNSSRSISFEGFWSTNMFVQIRPGKEVFGLTRYDLYSITKDTRVNLAKADDVIFSSGYLTYTGSWAVSDKPGNDDYGVKPEFESARNKKCRVIEFHYRFQDDSQMERYVFLDEGEYHRAKRGIDDLTPGASKK